MPDTHQRLNVRGIILHFGGRTPLHRLLKKNGINVSIKTVEAWAGRNSIPANRLATLSALAKGIGKPMKIEDFFGPSDG